jgi:hypothetical protein
MPLKPKPGIESAPVWPEVTVILAVICLGVFSFVWTSL